MNLVRWIIAETVFYSGWETEMGSDGVLRQGMPCLNRI